MDGDAGRTDVCEIISGMDRLVNEPTMRKGRHAAGLLTPSRNSRIGCPRSASNRFFFTMALLLLFLAPYCIARGTFERPLDPTLTPEGAAVAQGASAVVICGIDGSVYTLDARSGELRGMFASGPALVSSSSSSSGGGKGAEGSPSASNEDSYTDDLDNDNGGVFDWESNDTGDQPLGGEGASIPASSGEEQIVPGLDGNLYSLLPPLPSDQSSGLRLELLPMSVTDVMDAPISTCAKQGRCSVVMGDKQSKIFRLNPATGSVVWLQRSSGQGGGFTAADSKFLSSFDTNRSTHGGESGGGAFDPQGQDWSIPEKDEQPTNVAAVMLQREDYVLRSIDSRTGEEIWNVTLGRFSALDFGNDSESTADAEETSIAEQYRINMVPLPSIAFGEDGSSVVAIDSVTGLPLWHRQLDGIVAAVYGVGGLQRGWIPLEVIDDFDFTHERNGTPNGEEGRLLLGDGGSSLLLPSVPYVSENKASESDADGMQSRALLPYNRESTSSAALITKPSQFKSGEMPQTYQIGRVRKHSDTLFVTSVSRTLFSILDEDMCENIDGQEHVEGMDEILDIAEGVDYNEFESLTPVLLEHGLIPPDATRDELMAYSALYSSIIEATKVAVTNHSRQTANGLFLSWSLVAIMACAVIGAIVGIRVGYRRQKRTWKTQNIPSLSPMMVPSSRSIDGQLTPMQPLTLNGEHSVETRSSFSHSASMPILHASDSNQISLGDDALEQHTHDPLLNSVSPSNKLLSRAVTHSTAPQTDPSNKSTNGMDQKTSEEAITSAASKESSKSYGVDNLDGIPLIRYSRYASEFQELSALGRGGFGTVFKCTNALDGRLYAIKKIRIMSELGFDGLLSLHFKEKLHRVLREVKILALLDHPHIVRYYTAWLEVEEGDGSKSRDMRSFPDQPTLGRCYSSEFLTGASPSASFSESGFSFSRPNLGRGASKPSTFGRQANPLGWNNFVGSSSILDASEEGDYHPSSQGLTRQSSEDDLGFNWERSSSNLSSLDSTVLRPGTTRLQKLTSELSVVGDEDEATDGNGESGSSFGSLGDSNGHESSCSGSSSSSLSEIDEGEGTPALDIEATSNDGKAKVATASNQPKDEQAPETGNAQRHMLYIQMQLCSQNTLADFLSDPHARRNPEANASGDDNGSGPDGDASTPEAIIGGVDIPHALRLFIQIARGVMHVHNQGLIHRDLKPMNCFIDESGVVKIGDFGLSRESSDTGDEVLDGKEDGKEDGEGRPSLGAGEDNTVGVGTRAYASPEQMAGSAYDASTDVYSLGIILFELCYPMYTGMERHLVFRGLRVLTFPDQWSRTVAMTFPALHILLVEMLSQDPRDRPTSASIVERADDLLGEYTCSLLGLDFSMYQRLRQLDRANEAKQAEGQQQRHRSRTLSGEPEKEISEGERLMVGGGPVRSGPRDA